LDVTKTRLQLDNKGRYKGMIHGLRTIAAEEGARALYKGLTPFVTHLTLKYALRFGSFGFFKNMLGVEKDGKGEAWKNFTAGLLSGLLEAVVIVTPFEVVKTRLQKQEGTDKTKLRYKGPIHAAVTVAREEGYSALWKGCVPTMLRQGSNQAFNFMAFAFLQRHVFQRVEGDGQNQALWKPFATGLIASTIGPLLNCPLDVIKTRLMAQDTKPGEKAKYQGWVNTMMIIAREEGVAALWKGLIPRLARLAPGQAITWTVVTTVQTWFERRAIESAQRA
jgi:solute carrier family 25 (mitochondrial citrate transporter), member 1